MNVGEEVLSSFGNGHGDCVSGKEGDDGGSRRNEFGLGISIQV